MVINNYISLLKKPEEIQASNTFDLKSIVKEYPYFQSAKALYLKSLKKQESFKYNHQLKVTAAYTNDRTILFNFITSKKFNTQTQLRELPKKAPVTSSNEQSLIETEEALNIGKPIPFSKKETYSFNEWLNLANKKPIIREQPIVKKSKKASIIDNFIATSPKISRPSKTTITPIKPVETNTQPTQLMTETLAKVYLEQKKFDNAIKAYEILSLKYPEKSGFFADQIKKIQHIQNNK